MHTRSEIVSVRFTVDELALIDEAAAAAGMTVSAYLRNAAALAALQARPGAVSCELPCGGYLVFWSNVPHAPVTHTTWQPHDSTVTLSG
jgi:hypothetical protein